MTQPRYHTHESIPEKSPLIPHILPLPDLPTWPFARTLHHESTLPPAKDETAYRRTDSTPNLLPSTRRTFVPGPAALKRLTHHPSESTTATRAPVHAHPSPEIRPGNYVQTKAGQCVGVLQFLQRVCACICVARVSPWSRLYYEN